MAEQCAQHPVLIQRLDHLATSLDDNTRAVRELLDKSNAAEKDTTRHDVEVANIKSDLAELKAADGDQWSAINSLRAKVYIGVGLALAGSTLATLFAGLVGK